MSHCLITKRWDGPEQLQWFDQPHDARQAFVNTPTDTAAALIKIGPPHVITAARLAPLVTLRDLERAFQGG